MRKAVVALVVLSGCGGSSFSQGHAPPKQPPANAVGGFSIELPAVTLKPGEETLPCVVFPLALTGSSHIVGGATLTTGPGMHHGNITTRPKTGEGIRDCTEDDKAGGSEANDIIKGGAVLFGSSTQLVGQEWQSFPDGMGYRIEDGYEIVARMHYLNASAQSLTVAPVYQWYTIDESKLTQEIYPFIWEFKRFSIAPGATVTVTGECPFPFKEHPMHVVSAMPHMHKLGVEFAATAMAGGAAGETFLDSPGYDPEKGVITQYDPAVDLSGVEGFTFSCTWRNTFDKTIVEGIGDNEMCMMFGYGYPRDYAYTAVASDGTCVLLTPP